MTSRETFLDRIRDRLKEPSTGAPLRPLATFPPGESDGFAVDLSDPEGRFLEAATAAGAEIVGAPDDELSTVLERVVRGCRPRRAVVSTDPECWGADGVLTSLGVEVMALDDRAAVADAELGVTGALAGVALTGSLVVDPHRGGSRLASLLPEVHLALVDRRRITATPGDLLRDLARWFPDGLPSSFVLVTGPSRSADIELQITVGVHGPKRVLIALR